MKKKLQDYGIDVPQGYDGEFSGKGIAARFLYDGTSNLTIQITVLHQLDQKIIYPHYDFKHLTEKYFEIGMKLRACLKIQPDLTIGIGLHI